MTNRAAVLAVAASMMAWGVSAPRLSAQEAVLSAAMAPQSVADETAADDAQGAEVERVMAVGPVTHLPLPRYVSMKARESNVRRGPSLTHRIDWVFKRQDMPLEIVAEFGHWRRVLDQDGMGGWVHYSLLSGNRTVLVQAEMADLRMRPDPKAKVVAKLEQNVVARLGECGPDWCYLRVGSHRGWTEKTGLWGVGADEIRD